jgi:peptidoglycan/xylan/chitin deacetylase (PgdA/CDA1 family)
MPISFARLRQDAFLRLHLVRVGVSLAPEASMKRWALRLMQVGGVFAATRAMSAQMPRILMYHNFSESNETNAVSITALRDQLAYLRRHFSVVPLSEIVSRLRSGQTPGNHLAALTVDDGRRNFYEFMFPLLKKSNIPAVLFVVSSFINGEDWIWTDKILWLSEQLEPPMELAPERLDGFFRKLNQLTFEARAKTIAELAARMGVNIPQAPPPKYAPCSWEQLREMVDSGLVEIGSHTITHPILASMSDEESLQEVAASRIQIEQKVGRRIRFFCYPNGQPGDYRSSQIRQVQDAGYDAAVAACPGMVTGKSDLYELPRIGVGGDSDQVSFCKHLDGVDYYQVKMQRSLGLA